MLELAGVSKAFRGLKAVNNVSFRVERGEIVGLLGPNGAGKTTVFEIISGFLKPDTGDIYFDGQNIVGLRPEVLVKKGLSRTFQHPRPFGGLTVRQNIETASLFGAGKARWDHLTTSDQILEYCGLADRADIPAQHITPVEQRLLEIARVIACAPEIALLDEPLQGLTPAEVVPALDLIRRLNSDLGVTVLLIEHNVRAMMSTANRVVALNYGAKVAEGSPEEVAQDPDLIAAYFGVDEDD